MKEYERIIKSGLVDEEFIKPEEKCGYLVTAERKKLFSVLLDMLYQFDRVCQKHGLVYFIMYGTLLGAVRHKGFIPWDDDMDVVMPREDYEKFMRLKDEFKEPLFFQTPYTDPGYFYTPIRIRNSNTTAIVEKFKYAGFNHGIWFSVFPLDNWSEADGRKKYSEINELVVKESTYMRISNPHLSSADQQRVAL